MTGTRTLLRGTLRVELNRVTPVAGAVIAIPVVTVFALGASIDNIRGAIAMAVGANLIAIVSLVGAPRLPIRFAILDSFALGFSVFAGASTAPFPWAHISLLILWCFVAGMLVVLGQTQATVGTQAIIAYLVLGRFAGSPLVSLRLAALVFIGAMFEVIALVVLRLPPTLRYQRNQLADAFDAVADLARRSPNRSGTDVLAILDATERSLSAPSLFARNDVRELRASFDQIRRVRLELTTLSGLRARLDSKSTSKPVVTLDTSLDAAAETLLEVAQSLRHLRRPSRWLSMATMFEEAISPLRDASESGQSHDDVNAIHFTPYLDAIGGQIRAAGNLVEVVRRSDSRHAWLPRLAGARSDPETGRFLGDIAIIQESLRSDSSARRHAVRLAIAVPVSAVLALWLSLPRGYWVPFAVAVILRPDYSTLLTRGVGRIFGTLLGATLAALLVSALRPDLLERCFLVALAAWAAYSTWAASFSVAMGFVTALILILLSTSLPNTTTTAVDRLIDVTLGGAIALAAYLIWPTPPGPEVERTQSDLFAAMRAYLSLVFSLVEHTPVPSETLQSASRAARLARTRAEDAVSRSMREPRATRVGTSRRLGLMAATLRVIRVIHALRIEAERGATIVAFIELDALCSGLLLALDAIADALAGKPSQPFDDLRQLYRAAAGGLSAVSASPTIALHLDELVNAVNTAALLVGTPTR